MPRRENVCCEETNYVLGELVKYVMEDSGCGIEQAMEKVYTSPLVEALQMKGTNCTYKVRHICMS